MMTARILSFVALAALAGAACSSEETAGSGGVSGSSGASGDAGVSGSGGAAGSGASSGSGGSSGADAGQCDVSQVAGLAVAEVDLDAFPPYAVHGCRLLYVSAANGELILRELVSGSESVLAPASDAPSRPTIAGETMAWEATRNGKRAVVVSHAGTVTVVSGPFDHAGEPRASEDAVVLTGFLTGDPDGDSDIFLFDVGSGTTTLIAGGSAQQRFADVSETHVAFSDFSEDPNGFYDGDGISLADVALYDRASGQTISLPSIGKQAFPMLGGSGRLGFLEWVLVHPIPKLQAYAIKSVPLADPLAKPITIAEVESDVRVRPMAYGDLFEWVVRRDGVTSLHRAAVDGASPPSSVPVAAADLHAPVANQTTTVLAIRPALGALPELETIPR